MQPYKVYASLRQDLNEGFVWLKKPDLPTRCLVKIRNASNRRSVFCEALQFESNFLSQYNQPPRTTIADEDLSIVINAWYRARLGGLEPHKEYPLEITRVRSWWGRMRACMHHPQNVVRVAVWLGLVSVGLGIIGVILGVISVCPR
jgi:hypothetical protein